MKKIFTQLLMSMALTAIALNANAKLVDLGEMQLDTDYEIKADFNSYIGTFTATTDGTIIATGTNSTVLEPYRAQLNDMEAEGNHIAVTYDNYYGDKQYHFDVTAGTTYYFYLDFAMNATTFRLTMDSGEGLAISKTTPEAGSIFSVSDGGLVSVQFNRAVRMDGVARIVAGDKEATVVINGQNNIYSLEIKEPLYNWLQDGTLKGGDKFIIRMTNVAAADDATNIYGTDGTADIEYIIGEMPIQLVSSENTTGTFKSYYLPNDPTGIVTLTFDGDVSSAKVSLTFGSTDVEGDYYVEDITPIIEGNTIKVDLTGKSRTPDNMVASGTNYNNMTLSFNKVLDSTGQHAYSAGQGTIGGYAYTYDELEVVTADVISDFTPASGSTLQLLEYENIEIWITDEAKLVYDGVKFSSDIFYENPIVVTDFTKEADEFDPTATILLVPFPWEYIPMVTKGDNESAPFEINVTLNNLQSADGIDHTADVTATYYIDNLGAVDKVFGEETTEFTVYNTKGILVLQTTDREALRNLPNGIYIINGKKFLIKR